MFEEVTFAVITNMILSINEKSEITKKDEANKQNN